MTDIAVDTLRALFDVAVSSLNFGSGFLDDEEVACLREVAGILGIDPDEATPDNFKCKYRRAHHPQVFPDTPIITGPDGINRNTYLLRDRFPADVQGKLKPGGPALGLLRAKAIATWCPGCGRRFDTFEDTAWREPAGVP